jgi:hypothetical protein
MSEKEQSEKTEQPNEESESQEETGEESATGAESATDDGGKQLKELLDGTARLGHSIGETFKGVADIFQGRDYVVMVRVNQNSIDKIDQLVSSGLFKSRSESAAFLIGRGIITTDQVFDKIKEKVSEIDRLKEELKKMMAQ